MHNGSGQNEGTLRKDLLVTGTTGRFRARRQFLGRGDAEAGRSAAAEAAHARVDPVLPHA